MPHIWLYTIASIFVVSLISLIGVITLSVNLSKLKKAIIYLVSFSAGALLGDVFIHLIPETVEAGFTITTSSFILGGIVLFFALEKLIHWQHCHAPITREHRHTFAIMNLIGDGFHNFLDGVIIGASYLVGTKIGIATTIAVMLHEIPQEIGDFGVLIHGGFKKSKALFFNFLSALTAFLGAAFALVASTYIENIELFLIPLAIGGFIYIAGSDLIPELHKDFETKKSIWQLLIFIAGILIMAALLLLE